jgi:hypothetical protein
MIDQLKYAITVANLDIFSVIAERKKERMKRMREIGMRGERMGIIRIVMGTHGIPTQITHIAIVLENTITIAIIHLAIDLVRGIIEEMIQIGGIIAEKEIIVETEIGMIAEDTRKAAGNIIVVGMTAITLLHQKCVLLKGKLPVRVHELVVLLKRSLHFLFRW